MGRKPQQQRFIDLGATFKASDGLKSLDKGFFRFSSANSQPTRHIG